MYFFFFFKQRFFFGYSFRCEHKIFPANLKRGPSCHEAAPQLYCGALFFTCYFLLNTSFCKIFFRQARFHVCCCALFKSIWVFEYIISEIFKNIKSLNIQEYIISEIFKNILSLKYSRIYHLWNIQEYIISEIFKNILSLKYSIELFFAASLRSANFHVRSRKYSIQVDTFSEKKNKWSYRLFFIITNFEWAKTYWVNGPPMKN